MEYSLGWSDSMQRVVIPIYSNGTSADLIAVCCRSCTKAIKPKYLIKQQHTGTLFVSKPKCNVMQLYSSDTLLVAEDILSVIRLGRFARSLSILGTWVNDSFLSYVLEHGFKRVICWYDNDPAGYKAARSSRRKLKLMGVDVLTVRTDKDPKRYSNREIASILKGVTMDD